eukprot:1374412-Amorphochlora_amoeboformis.AAC.2
MTAELPKSTSYPAERASKACYVDLNRKFPSDSGGVKYILSEALSDGIVAVNSSSLPVASSCMKVLGEGVWEEEEKESGKGSEGRAYTWV